MCVCVGREKNLRLLRVIKNELYSHTHTHTHTHINRQTFVFSVLHTPNMHSFMPGERQTDSERDRERDRQTARETERERDRQ